MPFVWAEGRTAVVTVECKERAFSELVAHLWPFVVRGRQQGLTVSLNGTALGHVVLREQPQEIIFPTDERLWRPGANFLRFDFDYAVSPRDTSTTSRDPRPLAAAFDWLDLRRQGTAGS